MTNEILEILAGYTWQFFAVAMIPAPFYFIGWGIKWVLGQRYD